MNYLQVVQEIVRIPVAQFSVGANSQPIIDALPRQRGLASAPAA
ncbi:hypothetical protein NYO99_17940 [Pelomonas sp. UHG3]|uniref:Uncharacterized protein n=1 Tax=Roseateles hydrophilus TaxID=2975054 RepID=A0ACC6CEQ9_9BURK|nr:hypothetical protein [Pelomonas sp. UHG3]MCY4746861.1 hypothetical protein [Pelomonas sp. UHG3]